MTESGIGALGLDPWALLFQVVNFGLLLILLRLFAYKPVLKILESRRQRIEESLRSAQAIAVEKAALEQRVQAVLAEAERKAQAIIAASKLRATEAVMAAEAEAQHRAVIILQQAQNQLEQEVAMARQELKQETLRLIAETTRQLLAEEFKPAADERLVRRALAAAEQKLAVGSL